jgi:predicted DNA-binding transcriptional regulator AlpA
METIRDSANEWRRLVDYEGLQKRGIRYSRPHLWRLWTTGKFPKPIKLSASRNAWLEADIDAWIKARISERDYAAA